MTSVLRSRLTLMLIAVGFLALAVIVATTIWLTERARKDLTNVVSARALRAAVVEVASALQTAESSQRGYLYTNNEIYLAPYDAAITRTRKQLKMMDEGLMSYPQLTAARARVRDTIKQKIDEMQQTIQLKKTREDGKARALLETNKGKALMDEARVYLSGIERTIDRHLIEGAEQQRSNTELLRLISVVSAIVIMGVAAIVAYFVQQHTSLLANARLEVVKLNTDLEHRISNRTMELARANEDVRAARDRAETLLTEVNHRVANSLAVISSMIRMQSNSMTDKVAKDELAQTNARIQAMSLVHRNLYTSDNAKFVELDKYLGDLMKQLQETFDDKTHRISFVYFFAPGQLPINSAISLGVILNEWVSNALKYAYPTGSGEIRVSLKLIDQDTMEFSVSDDGKSSSSVDGAKGTGFGSKIVRAMAVGMNASVELDSTASGTTARLRFVPQRGETSSNLVGQSKLAG